MMKCVWAFLFVASAEAQDTPPSRSGVVLFKLPAERQRKEEAEFTVLKLTNPAANSIEIRIRPAVEAKGTAGDALAAHAQVLAQNYTVQPGGEPYTGKHPAGFDLGIRSYFLQAADGRQTAMYACVLHSGTKSAAVEFIADTSDAIREGSKAIYAFLDSCRLAHAQVVVAGEPPLTHYDLEETLDFLQWLVDVPFTGEQREVFREEIVDGWKKKDAETIQSVAQISQMRAELAKLSVEKQDFVRRQSEEEVVAALRKETDRASKLLMQIYESARKPIAEGDPPLTRQQSDSALEVFYFIAAQLEGVQAKPTAEEKNEWAKRLIERWSKFDAAARKQIATMPLTWAATRAGWPEMSEADREEIKKGFAQLDIIKEIRSIFAKAKSESGVNAAAEISKMQQNHQMSMMLLKTGYDSTMTQMAAMRNMVDTRNRWSYRPR